MDPKKYSHKKSLQPVDVILHSKRCGQVKDLEGKSLTWITQESPKCHDKCVYNKKAKGDFTHRGKANVKMKAEIGVMKLQNQACQDSHQKLGEART